MSKPLQVYVEEDELDRLDAWARARGWTKSQAVRAAIRALTRAGRDAEEDPLFALSGMVIDGLPADCAENFDAALLETYVAESAPRYRATKRPRAARRRPRR